MKRIATDVQGPSPSLPLPGNNVLNSGAVVFPGAFDQHGCPLVVFPVDAQDKLISDVSKAEVVDFVNYFLGLYKKQEKESLVSAVADLRQASLFTTRFIIETFLLLELHRRTIHTVYMIQPKKKDVLKLLLRLLVPSKSCVSPFKRVLLKEVSDLSNYVDRSQLTPSLGGYLVYCHCSWVTFIKEIDAFVQEFLLVVQRLPSSISTLQALARQPVPSTYDDLKDFCFTNEAKFQQLRRDLGLDELLRHCEQVVEKLRYPEDDSCYQAMAGTALFTHTAFDMLQNYSRITAAIEKIELLWQQVFSKAKIQLQLCRLREEALLITEQIERLQNEKLQPYSIEIANDAVRADMLTSEFESTIYSPAMALVRCAEDVIHTLLEVLPPSDVLTREKWVQDLDRLKENLSSAVKLPQRTLKTVSDFYCFHKKANSWYSLVLCENLLQELIGGVSNESQPKKQHPQQECTDFPLWRQALSDFVRKNPCPDVEELVQLAHLANVIPDAELQLAGKQLSKRCLALRKLLTSQSTVPLSDLQLALQWQYELLRGNRSHIDLKGSQSDLAMGRSGACPSDQSNACYFSKTSGSKAEPHTKENLHCRSPLYKCGPGKKVSLSQTTLETFPSSAVTGGLPGIGKPPSLSSFDSGFDGAGSNHLEAGAGRDGWEGLSRLAGSRDGFRPITRQPQIHEENISSVSDSEGRPEEFLFGSVGNTSMSSIQIIPKITVDYLNFEIKVKRSATPPQNPWLSLPVDDLENSYTVTITQNPPGQQRDLQGVDPSEHTLAKTDQSTPTKMSTSPRTEVAQVEDCILTPQDCFEDSDFSGIQNVLSSTVTDVTHEPNNTTGSLPTLLWDSYDFHNQKQDTWDRTNRSLADNSLHEWDLKEQKGLREVEKILDRAAEILEEEENVLAQEAVLDVLMTTEHSSEQVALWGSNDQLGVMSSSELMEAGVLGLEGDLDAADSMGHGKFKSTETTAEADTFDDVYNDKGLIDAETSCNSRVLLKELRGLHILDEMILEENLKIHELRRREKYSLGEEPPELRRCHSARKDRGEFLVDLEREKREVERMENSLEKDIMKCKLKKRLVKTRKAVKCSIMERTKSIDLEDGALYNELLLGSRSQHSNSQCLTPKTTFHTHNSNLPHTIPCPDNEAEMALQDLGQPVYTKAPGDTELYRSMKDTEPTSNCAKQPILPTPKNVSDREESSREIVIQPQEKQGPNSGFEEVSNESTAIYITPEMCSKPEAFDPGGISCSPPVPKPRKALLAVHDMPFSSSNSSEQICRLDVEEPNLNAKLEDVSLTLEDALPKPKEPKSKIGPKTNGLMLSPDLSKHHNNNNNNPLLDLPSSVCSSHDESHARVVSFDVSDGPQMTEKQLSQKFDLVQGPAEEVTSESSLHEPSILTSVSCDPSVTDAPLKEHVPDVPPSGSNLPVGHWSGTIPTRYFARSPPNHPQLNINIREMTHFKTPIVLDTGSGLTKAGFADQDLPTTIFPTIIGLPKYEEIMNGNFERETYIGHEAQHMRGVLALKYPMKNGIICKWDEMEKIWQHTFQQLQVDPEDHPVLLTEAAMNPTENRQRMVELMFECFNVPLTYVAMQAVLALYAAGRSTGVVFDSGDGVSHSVPVFEGYCLPHAVQRFTLAGLDVTLHLKKLLLEQGVCMRTSAEVEIVREMKEKCCCVAKNYESELTFGGSSSSEVHYTMPDGQVISLSTERFRAPEILFKPELIGRDHYGMHESIFKSILSSDIDLRRMFLGNIVLSGGNTLLPGLPERLQEEIRGMVPSDMGECVLVTSPRDRDFLVWSGGSVLANLPSFASAWISQEEYEEFGPQIVFRKCF